MTGPVIVASWNWFAFQLLDKSPYLLSVPKESRDVFEGTYQRIDQSHPRESNSPAKPAEPIYINCHTIDIIFVLDLSYGECRVRGIDTAILKPLHDAIRCLTISYSTFESFLYDPQWNGEKKPLEYGIIAKFPHLEELVVIGEKLPKDMSKGDPRGKLRLKSIDCKIVAFDEDKVNREGRCKCGSCDGIPEDSCCESWGKGTSSFSKLGRQIS